MTSVSESQGTGRSILFLSVWLWTFARKASRMFLKVGEKVYVYWKEQEKARVQLSFLRPFVESYRYDNLFIFKIATG